VVRNGDWWAFSTSSGVDLTDGSKTHRLLSGRNIAHAEGLVLDSGEVYLAAIVDDGAGNELVLAYGSPSAPKVATIPVITTDGGEITPSSASITADGDRVLVVVSGIEGASRVDNAIAWSFLIP
jgi:hypothetical protein